MPEVAEEKQGQQQPPSPSPAAPRKPVFPLLGRIWIVLAAAAWGATAAHLLSHTGWLGARSLAVGKWLLAPGGAAAGAFVAVVLAFFLIRKFGSRLGYFKPGQATAVRVSSYVGIAAVTLFGAASFYNLPPTSSVWWEALGSVELAGWRVSLRPVLFPSAGIFFGVVLLAHLLMNREKWGDFLIETEGELKKVAWPARKEFLGSSVVVILVIVIISVFLYFADWVLTKVMLALGIGF